MRLLYLIPLAFLAVTQVVAVNICKTCTLADRPNRQPNKPCFKADPKSSNHYYMCGNRNPNKMTCPSGTVWSQKQLTCKNA